MIENLTQLFVARAAERPDLRVGTIEEQLTLPDALRRAAGGAPDPVVDHQSGTGHRARARSRSPPDRTRRCHTVHSPCNEVA